WLSLTLSLLSTGYNTETNPQTGRISLQEGAALQAPDGGLMVASKDEWARLQYAGWIVENPPGDISRPTNTFRIPGFCGPPFETSTDREYRASRRKYDFRKHLFERMDLEEALAVSFPNQPPVAPPAPVGLPAAKTRSPRLASLTRWICTKGAAYVDARTRVELANAYKEEHNLSLPPSVRQIDRAKKRARSASIGAK